MPSGVCEACGAEGSVHRDHNHKTGFIRGLLCAACNSALGFAHDDPARLAALIEYLKRGDTDVLYERWPGETGIEVRRVQLAQKAKVLREKRDKAASDVREHLAAQAEHRKAMVEHDYLALLLLFALTPLTVEVELRYLAVLALGRLTQPVY